MPTQRFRKKPVEIDAVRNTGEWAPIVEFLDSVGCGRIPFGHIPDVTRNADGTLNIRTLEGVMRADVGDWVIRGVQGEFYPCKPDIFAATYEDATSAPTDDVYRERARLVAFLASLFPSVLAYADPDEPDWAVVYVSTPAGQLSWHIASGDVELFDHVPKVTPDDRRAEWDGHDTPTKYERLTALTTLAGTASARIARGEA